MNWNRIWKDIQKASPLLLTILGSAGVIGTAVLTAKATPKAMKLIEEKQEKSAEPLKATEKILAAAPAYLPAAGVGAVTILSIVSANLLNRKQNLSLAATCSLLQGNFKDYKGKVKELFGEKADQEVQKAIAKDKYDAEKVIKPRDCATADCLLWYEPNTGIWFEAPEADIIHAEYEVNRMLATYGSCSLKHYCELLHFPESYIPKGSDNLGWDVEDIAENFDSDYYWIDFNHVFIEDPDDENLPPYWIIETYITPEWDFELERRPEAYLYIDENQNYAYDVR